MKDENGIMPQRKKKWIVLIIVIVMAVIAAGLIIYLLKPQKKEEEQGVPVLTSYWDGVHYTFENMTLKEYRDANWTMCLVDVPNQLYEISGLSLNFSGSNNHSVIWLDSGYNVVKAEELKGGKHILETEPGASIIAFSVRNREREELNLQAVLSAEGTRQRELLAQESPFFGKNLSVVGDSLSAFEGYIPTGYYPQYPSGDVTLPDMWWYQVARNLGMNISRINACAGSGVTHLTWSTELAEVAESPLRGTKLDVPGSTPDVILVWIGGNDMLMEASHEYIAEEYRKLMQNIADTYPDAEVYMCTYYVSALNYVDPEGWLNQEIEKIAGEFNAGLINAADCGIDTNNQGQYLLDPDENYNNLGMHPNKAGFDLIADTITEELIENKLR